MRPYRVRAWSWFVGTALLLLAVVSWLTVTLHRLDRDEVQARRQADLQEKMRLALWRMDSWLSPQLAREAIRPATEYRSFASAGAAWTRGFNKLAPDEVVVPSPLLGFQSPVFALHFEVGPSGALESPQVPTGNQRDVAEINGLDASVIERARERLATMQPILALARLEQKLGSAEALLPAMGCNIVSPELAPQTQQSVSEFSNRQMAYVQNVGNAMPQPPNPMLPVVDGVGPMVPFWLDAGSEPCLVFARRVGIGSALGTPASRIQGIVVDWPQLQRELLQLVQDLFPPDCTHVLRCDRPTPAEQASMLASLPARLQAVPGASLTSGLPMGAILWITWGVTLLALGALGFTLRAAIGFGERRARFASAVTHELRTPLTTFRMYSEMLAEGIVTEPAAQREYLATLQRESDRLSRVVENVLAWSRLEEGRFSSRREQCEVGGLVERATPTLQRRLVDANMKLEVAVEPSARGAVLATDEDAVGQILFNLVDNAAKYGVGAGVGAGEAKVELRVDVGGGVVRLAVRDHGPGVPANYRQRIFAPFDRGVVPAASNDAPGVGLGLALARGLARDLGGELRLDETVQGGACFVLSLPCA